MKVLQINSVCGIRSTGRITTDIADVLSKNGHECRIIYGRESVPERYKSIAKRFCSYYAVKINGIKSRIFDNEGFNAKKETRVMIEYIKEYAPDVVHIHNAHGYYLNIELLLGFLAEENIPIVYTMHDCWAITGHCAHFNSVNCERWKTGCYDCPLKNAYPRSIVVDKSKRNWEKKKNLFDKLKNIVVVTPSEWLAEVMRESYLGDKEIMAIPNGVDLNVFKPTQNNFKKQYGLENKYIIMGVATAWGERKGLKEFCELQNVLGSEYQIVLVGMTKNQVAELPGNIIGLERTNSAEELAKLYTAADIFVNAGKAETMGLTTVEAMACGTPAVVSNLTAVPEVVDANGGRIFEEYSVEYMAQKIREVMSIDFLDTRKNALKYEKQQQYEKYMRLYERLADKKR